MVLIPTSLAGFSPECFPEQVAARTEKARRRSTRGTDTPIVSQVFSIVKIF
jgi:hypothetical protein